MKETIQLRSTLFGQYRVVQLSDKQGYPHYKTYFDTSSPLIFGKSALLYSGTCINRAHDAVEEHIQAKRAQKYKPVQIEFSLV